MIQVRSACVPSVVDFRPAKAIMYAAPESKSARKKTAELCREVARILLICSMCRWFVCCSRRRGHLTPNIHVV